MGRMDPVVGFNGIGIFNRTVPPDNRLSQNVIHDPRRIIVVFQRPDCAMIDLDHRPLLDTGHTEGPRQVAGCQGLDMEHGNQGVCKSIIETLTDHIEFDPVGISDRRLIRGGLGQSDFIFGTVADDNRGPARIRRGSLVGIPQRI